jgi:hypothetical protein
MLLVVFLLIMTIGNEVLSGNIIVACSLLFRELSFTSLKPFFKFSWIFSLKEQDLQSLSY